MSGNIRVLHVEDDPDFAELVAAFLEREIDAIAIETATDPSRALELIEQQPFDCIISDYDMPELDGIELLQEVRQDNPNLPFILYTGKGSEEVASEAISAGVTDYLRKSGSSETYQLLANRIIDAVEHQHSRTNYQEIFEKSPDGIVVHDAETFEFVDMNERYAEMYGYDSKEEFLDAGFESIIVNEPPYTLETARELVQQAIEQGPETFEWLAGKRDGTQFWAEVHLTPVQLNGEDRVLAAVRDVTERHEYEEELERTNERLDEFASVVSHDLRNPLSVATGRLELAREEVTHEELDAVARALERMDGLIDELLALARESESTTELQAVPLADVAKDCWHNVDTGAAELDLVTTRTLRADPGRLRRLLENLIRNAVEHGGDGVIVRVGDLEDGFFIEDDGEGIPPPERERIFEAGYSTRPGGTGFGLSIVNRVADAHGWEIRVTEGTQGGARFEFTGVRTD